MSGLLYPEELSPSGLATQVLRDCGTTLIFIGGRIKGSFFKNSGTDEVEQKIYNWLNDAAKAGIIRESEILKRLNRTLALLRQVCKLDEVKRNPVDIQFQIRRRRKKLL